MAQQENNYLVYTSRKDKGFIFGTLLILFLCIFAFKYWYRLGFNILFLGYFIFREMRLATVFYASIVRIILYPSALINKALSKNIKQTEEKYQEIREIKHVFERDFQKKSLLKTERKVFLYSWFHLCFLTMNAVTIGAVFFQKFTKEKLMEMLYMNFYLPKSFPIKTTALLPVVGMIDLAVPNLTLNFYSAVGAGLVGVVEVFLNKKASRRQLIKYLVFFPLGAYFITYWVPSGFEFALIVFEILTIGIIVAENISKSRAFKTVTTSISSQTASAPVKPENQEVKKNEVKDLIKEVITEASQDSNKKKK